MRRPDNKNRDGSMSQHFDRFAAQHDRRYSTPAVRSHDNKIAWLSRRRVDDGLIRVIVLDVYRVAVHARGRYASFAELRYLAARFAMCFAYCSGVSVTISGSTANVWNGVDTVRMVTLALIDLAKAAPCAIAFCESSEPSVGIRICLYMECLDSWSSRRDQSGCK